MGGRHRRHRCTNSSIFGSFFFPFNYCATYIRCCCRCALELILNWLWHTFSLRRIPSCSLLFWNVMPRSLLPNTFRKEFWNSSGRCGYSRRNKEFEDTKSVDIYIFFEITSLVLLSHTQIHKRMLKKDSWHGLGIPLPHIYIIVYFIII